MIFFQIYQFTQKKMVLQQWQVKFWKFTQGKKKQFFFVISVKCSYKLAILETDLFNLFKILAICIMDLFLF